MSLEGLIKVAVYVEVGMVSSLTNFGLFPDTNNRFFTGTQYSNVFSVSALYKRIKCSRN